MLILTEKNKSILNLNLNLNDKSPEANSLILVCKVWAIGSLSIVIIERLNGTTGGSVKILGASRGG